MILIAISGANTVALPIVNTRGQEAIANSNSSATEDNIPDLVPGFVGGKKRYLARKVTSTLFDVTAYGLLLLAGAANTPGALKVLNHTLQSDYVGVAAKPSLVERKVEFKEVNFDGFLSNFESSKYLIDSFNILDLNPYEFDLNKNGLIFDSVEEINHAKKLLKEGYKELSNLNEKATVEKAISFLKDYELLSIIVWGENGPNKNMISQNSEPNCQTMSAFKGLFLTEPNIQESKNRIKITSFKLKGKDPYINFEVFVAGKWIPVSYEELRTASCPKGYSASGANDGSLFPALFKVACNKASKDIVPNWWFSNSSTIFANEDYIPMFLLTLSDHEMKEILSQAPEKIVTVAGKFNIRDIKNGITLRQKNWNNPVVSAEKASNFDINLASKASSKEDDDEKSDNHQVASLTKNDTKASDDEDKVQESDGDVNPLLILSSFPPSSPNNRSGSSSVVELLPASSVRNGHVYVVESFDGETDTMIISDAHGDRVKLSGMDEIRSNLSGVICPEDSVGTFAGRSFPIYLLLGSLGVAYCLGKKSIHRT